MVVGQSVSLSSPSGNTGIGLSFIATSREYKLILTMPMPMNMEMRFLLKAFGVKLVLTDAEIPNKTLKSCKL
jgi:cysteine synthase A